MLNRTIICFGKVLGIFKILQIQQYFTSRSQVKSLSLEIQNHRRFSSFRSKSVIINNVKCDNLNRCTFRIRISIVIANCETYSVLNKVLGFANAVPKIINDFLYERSLIVDLATVNYRLCIT